MINNKDISISNKSYTNKDFASIYPEEVDLFKSLTKRYDPETSNESDPFIVNLKTNAFIADKLCYNIDKNVLENYMPSATQETSMRDLCSRLGYEMKYYQASATEIYFKYNGSIFSTYSNASYFNISRFTEITSQDGTVSFVTITDRQYNKNDEYVTVDALQGVLGTLKVADSDVIHLENLNNQNRIYFSESIVAENGVFVTSVDDKKIRWKKTENLNLELPNTHCFKFGYDSVNRWPFIEFPADVASLIGSGVRINYIVTQGVDGNVNAGYLTKIASQAGFYVYDSSDKFVDDSDGKHVTVDTSTDNTELVVKNTSASIGGENPESIDEAYNNFKKTIGTFDTLDTCRDYANAIYNMYNSAGTYPVVSNVQVSDRRDDINYCNKVLSLDEYGTKYIYSNNDITPFDLCLYPLNAIDILLDNGYLKLGDKGDKGMISGENLTNDEKYEEVLIDKYLRLQFSKINIKCSLSGLNLKFIIFSFVEKEFSNFPFSEFHIYKLLFEHIDPIYLPFGVILGQNHSTFLGNLSCERNIIGKYKHCLYEKPLFRFVNIIFSSLFIYFNIN